jgi:glucose-6-phosphate dehydrogenase assembly protein OpcA
LELQPDPAGARRRAQLEEAVTATTVSTPHKQVVPKAIPDALRAIWHECCSGVPDENVSRSLTMNLVVVVDAAREAELQRLLEGLAARLPCRAFLAVVHAGDGAIAADVHGAARVSASGRTRDLVLEQIELRVPQSSFAQLAGVVRPLLVNDLPTHCYWATAWPRDARTFDALAAIADHTIVDSQRFELPASELDAVDQRRRAGRPLTDLTWLRLRPWRRALAEVFERAPFQQHAVTTVTIRHGEAGMAAVSLLGRWLEQRLHAQVALEASGQPTDGVLGIELSHSDAGATITRTSAAQIEVAVATPAACFLPLRVAASRGSEGDLLAAAIDLA